MLKGPESRSRNETLASNSALLRKLDHVVQLSEIDAGQIGKLK